MGGSCSCEENETKLKLCEKKLDSFEKLISSYSGNVKTDNMRSQQTNLGILVIKVDSNTNENCQDTNGLWSILEILAIFINVD